MKTYALIAMNIFVTGKDFVEIRLSKVLHKFFRLRIISFFLITIYSACSTQNLKNEMKKGRESKVLDQQFLNDNSEDSQSFSVEKRKSVDSNKNKKTESKLKRQKNETKKYKKVKKKYYREEESFNSDFGDVEAEVKNNQPYDELQNPCIQKQSLRYTSKPKSNKINLKDILLTSYAALSNVAMLVLLRLWGESAPDYSFLFVMVLAFGGVFFFLAAYAFERWRQKKVFDSWESAHFDRLTPILRQSVLGGALYAINYCTVIVSNPYVPGPIQIILSQSPILTSVISSSLILKRTYAKDAWIGAFLVFTGAVLSGIVPTLSNFEFTNFGYPFLYLVSQLVLGILPVCFEGFHKPISEVDGRRITAELRLVVTNLMLGFFLYFLLPIFMLLNQPSYFDFPNNISSGLSCIFKGSGGLDGNNCALARPIMWSMVAIVSAQMHSQIVLSRHRTGAFASMIVFTAPFLAYAIYLFLPGDLKEVPSLLTLFGAILSFFGVLVFGRADFRDQQRYIDLEKLPFISFFLDKEKTYK